MELTQTTAIGGDMLTVQRSEHEGNCEAHRAPDKIDWLRRRFRSHAYSVSVP